MQQYFYNSNHFSFDLLLVVIAIVHTTNHGDTNAKKLLAKKDGIGIIFLNATLW